MDCWPIPAPSLPVWQSAMGSPLPNGVVPVDSVVRVRTGERDDAAV